MKEISNQNEKLAIKSGAKYRAAQMLTGSALALALVAGFGSYAQAASAADTPAVTAAGQISGKARIDPMANIVSKIAARFGLNAADVQAVFDEQRTEMESQRTQAEAAQLQQAVADGKLTSAQVSLIAAKKAELKTQMEAKRASMSATAKVDFSTMTEAERTAQMEKMKADRESEITALKSWATANNIPAEFLMGLGGNGGHGGRGGPGGPGGLSGDGTAKK